MIRDTEIELITGNINIGELLEASGSNVKMFNCAARNLPKICIDAGKGVDGPRRCHMCKPAETDHRTVAVCLVIWDIDSTVQMVIP